MGYLSSDQESAVNSAMWDLHYNFAEKQPLYAIKKGSTTIVQEAASHNFLYPSAPNNSEPVETFQSGLFYARTYYLNEKDNQNKLNFQGNKDELGITVGDNILKLITDSTGKNLIGDATRIEWSGEYYKNVSSSTRHGLLQKNFSTFFFQQEK